MKKHPSRILNENSILLGLNQTDLLGVGCVFYVLQMIFHPFGLGIVSIILTAATGVGLICVRLNCRRKIIRDTIFYYFIKWFRGGIYHDPWIDKKI